VSDGVAQFAGAAHRRHGVQSALLSTRLTDAKAAGCDIAVPITWQPKLSALTVAAALVARERDGRGRHLEIAQSDVVLHQLAASAALVRLRPGTVTAGSHDLHEHVTMWTAARSPTDVAETLQRAGVPAAGMVRLPDLLDDPQLRARGTYTVEICTDVLGMSADQVMDLLDRRVVHR
jgi:crotonobetainyl-CoA:carnitine CoA-transferase CaiB-like acyl-CoA transferase